MSNTSENLQTAFAGESQANRRYLFFADKAEKEGHPQTARLFRAIAAAETVHARNHFEVTGGIKSTKDNLATAISGEHYEFTKMYPAFIEQAKSENNKVDVDPNMIKADKCEHIVCNAETSFTHANTVEKIHHRLYQKALETLEAGQELKDEPYFVCPICGNTVAGEAPEKCPICGTPRSKFKRVE